MIFEFKADLFTTKAKHILHGCNAQGVMGKGFALALKERYPWAYEAYAARHAEKPLCLGEVVSCTNGDVTIHHAITQVAFGYGEKHVSYDAIDKALTFLDPEAKVIAMPQIGAGLGGGHWPIIREIIRFRLRDREVYVYRLP